MEFIRCTVTDGPRPGYLSVEVASAEGHSEYFSIEERFLKRVEGEYLLPVQFIGNDKTQQYSLIQLPVEADSGANRVWVNDTLFLSRSSEAVA